MAKNKKIEVPHYELLYIISNQYTEEELAPIVEKVNKSISATDGRITHNEAWGKKRLAYPIKHNLHGYYFLVEFNLDPDRLAKLNKSLKMSSEILRYQIVVKKETTQVEKRAQEEKKQKIARRAMDEKKAEMEKEKLTTQPPKQETKKVDLKDLDEKLDKILDTDDLL